jgi:hypothetical protein
MTAGKSGGGDGERCGSERELERGPHGPLNPSRLAMKRQALRVMRSSLVWG